jgi:cytochrome c6
MRIMPSLRAMVILTAMAMLLMSMQAAPDGEPATESSRLLFEANCARCHGMDGAKGKWGAKDLRYSQLSNERIVLQMKNGKGIMPAFRKKLSEAELLRIVSYVKGLRIVGSP